MEEYKYQAEYESSPCFWGTKPAKYIRILAERLNSNLLDFKILDLGAGEGKNVVYFSGLGGNVLAVDVSAIALSRFNLQPGYQGAQSRIKILNLDIRNLDFSRNSFDIVIAYGIFHCLDTKEEVYDQIEKIKDWTNTAGYFVGSTFTNEIPPPNCQSYLTESSFLEKGELRSIFSDWILLEYEDDIITETHPTTQVTHQHSLSRIIAKKP